MEPLFRQLGFLPGERELRMTGRPALEVLQMLNPIPGIMNAMQQAGRAADPSLTPEERRAALGESAMETGIAALPVAGGALGRMVLRNAPAATRAVVGEAGDVMETLTGARPDAPDVWAETASDVDVAPVVDDGLIDIEDIDFEQEPFVEETFPAPVAPTVDQNIVNALEQPIAPAMDPIDQNIVNALEQDIDWTETANEFPDIDFNDDAAFNAQFSRRRDLAPLEPQQTGMLSTVGRAALNLEQPRYGSYDEVIANLKRLGARESELRTSGIGSLRDVEGPISQDMIRAAIEGDNPLEVIRYSGDFDPEYRQYFIPGGEDYREVVIRSPNALNVMPEGADFFEMPPRHFDSAGSNQVVHYRAATFPVDGGETYHVGEIQSDWAQSLRDARTELRISQMQPQEAGDFLRELHDNSIELQSRFSNLQDRQQQLDEDYNSGLLRVEDWGAQSQEIGDEIAQVQSELGTLNRNRNHLYRYFSGVDEEGTGLVRNDRAEPFVPEGPLVSSTNDVTQLAIRQALLDAVNSPQNYLTFGTGDMAISSTGGTVTGQRKYYDEIVPRQLRQTLRRLAREYDIEVPEVEQIRMYSNDRLSSYTVPGIQLTPELRQAIADFGMPMFKEGGMVNLNSGLASMAKEVL